MQKAPGSPIIDVRAPREFAAGNIPGAINLPLFDDRERSEIGILYKQSGRQAAINRGLAITGPKLEQYISIISALDAKGPLLVHCWRGGMRSQSMATLFDFAGYETKVLKGGYKSYRKAAHDSFEQPLPLFILGGRTGSGKTKILHALEAAGEQVLDLEKMAHHKGSAFGDLGEPAQPSTEMFENLLYDKLRHFDLNQPIWVEDESHLVGTVFIPEPFWEQMREASVLFCDVPVEERIRYLIEDYGNYAPEDLIGAVKKITKRLGGQHAKAAIEAFEQGDLATATNIVLTYYDKAYAYGLSLRKTERIHAVEIPEINPAANAAALIQFVKNNHIKPQYFTPTFNTTHS